MQLEMNRSDLRKNRLAARDQMGRTQRRECSRRIRTKLAETPLVSDAKHLFVYVHFRSEVETIKLINQLLSEGKTVSVPVTLLGVSRLLAVQLTDPAAQLESGAFGILEPTKERIAQATIDPTTIDIVLVPGSVFDQAGGRLGYGGGFYDRFFVQSAPQAARIGLAYELQMVEQVPMQFHDQYMDMVVTEEKAYNCRRLREKI
ncbi:MAG: 5-formyltetrahydrofolate cyclo-ligase [Candidatus Electrothrix sp. AR4]|nr:5-formyltetrahydrofolate cyclo-ligase [Candidatus Electrothrix sp. AR4]